MKTSSTQIFPQRQQNTPRKKRRVNSGGFPAHQRKALKLEIPATTEWTEIEGTCLGRRNCPFSALMHLFTVLFCTVTFLFLSSFSFFFFFWLYSVFFLSSFIPFVSAHPWLAAVSACVCVWSIWQDGGCSVWWCWMRESTPECRGAPNHVLAWPLNKLIFYGCTALPTLLLKGQCRSSTSFDLFMICTGCESLCLWEYSLACISNPTLLHGLDTFLCTTSEEKKQLIERMKRNLEKQ